MTCGRGCCASFKEHIQGVTFASTGELSRVNAIEKQWDKDGAAYKRMRAQGLQPKDIDGCARLEAKANDTSELQIGRPLAKREVKAIQELQNAG